jgi:PKD repeat protein
MKKWIFILGLIVCSTPLFATHIKGGELSYTFISHNPTDKTVTYELLLTIFMDCSSIPDVQDPSAYLSIFNRRTREHVMNVTAPASGQYTTRFDPNSNRCIGNPPSDVCYIVKEYTIRVTLAENDDGYIVAYQRCCRISNIRNLFPPSGDAGTTYMAEIPGNSVYPEAFKNSSPKFDNSNDATAVCAGSKFSFPFNATDKDAGDRIVYRLCSGFTGGTPEAPRPQTTSRPPFINLAYNTGYTGSQPLGPQVTIDSLTGVISGVAPALTGQYVLTVCAYEYRDDVLISIHRKEIHVGVSDCIPLNATLEPDYPFCKDLNIEIANLRVNPSGAIYTWDFGDGSAPVTSTTPRGNATHTYAAPGTYTIKVKVEVQGHCEEEATTIANVYPGFDPAFNVAGECIVNDFQFSDATYAAHGVVNKWSWEFGDETTTDDVSDIKNPVWRYSSVGLKTVRLKVESSVGCRDEITRDIEVKDKPSIFLPFRDTLICDIDTLALGMEGTGSVLWTPGYNIINANTPNPLVHPQTTTLYYVTLTNFGCSNTDSVLVRVTDKVILDAGSDTTICLTDPVTFNPSGNGLYFTWGPEEFLDDIYKKNPTALPTGNTRFTVTATIGKCSATDYLDVTTVPYPVANAGPDTIICYNTPAFLNGSMVASSFRWWPNNPLVNPTVLNTPTRNLTQSTAFILTVSDTRGCPKEVSDTMYVTVRDQIFPFAGNDTVAVVGQPIQFSGSGSLLYSWTPPELFNNPFIQNPVGVFTGDERIIMQTYTPEGCSAYDTVFVKVYASADIYVPNAFTPNGHNPVLKPVTPGIATMHYFRVYNRWGQLVYSSDRGNAGWDGKLNGVIQDTGTYVWMASGVDYTGRTITRKGTAVLIR